MQQKFQTRNTTVKPLPTIRPEERKKSGKNYRNKSRKKKKKKESINTSYMGFPIEGLGDRKHKKGFLVVKKCRML